MAELSPLLYAPEDFDRVYVGDEESLRHVVAELQGADAIGVDIEMGQRLIRKPGGLQEWRHILALLQIASDDVSVVVDPLQVPDLSPLRTIMAGPVRKVLLGGGQDAAMLETAGIPARNVADVGEVAYAIFGRREDGMAALARRIFGLELDKTVRRTDWLVRPLPQQLITYAFQDAELTLLIYRWFQQNYPDVLSGHERRELEPSIPPGMPDWLRDAISRGSSDASFLLEEHNLSVEHDAARMEEAIRRALDLYRNAPRRINRLIRISSDLGLRGLLPAVAQYAQSPSSLLRASAARAIGKLSTPEEGRPALEQLRNDPIEDVRKAAHSALKELNAPPKPAEEAVDAGPSLDDTTMAALQDLLERLTEAE